MKYSVTLRVNGKEQKLNLDARATLLNALREILHLTGTKKGCDQGQCGSCTVLLNGKRVNSCLVLAVMADGKTVTTIEGVSSNGELHPLQQSFLSHDGLQCGYCTPGQIVSALGFLNEPWDKTPEAVQIGMSGNLCRCGAYPNIVSAIEEIRSSIQEAASS
ncbi:MAG: 2Fe-2S iron-sulfur cluster-binding protein [Candidatus Eremiobacteraeota bacterium]|nr:2Fe-2S iron-sulfur cluster-binding protein [Candidatus Eremiobacteraeota bacterium]MCL5055198.1 2Fe-2S iron-sulfur cluster-binding protein [Bacillota bacterium]